MLEVKNQSPWMEKYRPAHFNDIVLDPFNKIILKNIIEKSYFPNLLLYGPPGTGKTTTIINLIKAYQEKNNTKDPGLIIHLNASDERGIDVIRNQILQFVHSKTLFCSGLKFVILDEVDYMTKNAQQALCYLLQSYSKNVRFCLICNYISRIDEKLQNEFIKLPFNQLPKEEIIRFLQSIFFHEKIKIDKQKIVYIQEMYKSDIRSMINFIQVNQNELNKINVIHEKVWKEMTEKIKSKNITQQNKYVQQISLKYNLDKKNIIKNYFNYLILYIPITPSLLNIIENVVHTQKCKNIYYVNYVLSKLSAFFNNKVVNVDKFFTGSKENVIGEDDILLEE
jgi:replication factor C subunit 3/5